MIKKSLYTIFLFAFGVLIFSPSFTLAQSDGTTPGGSDPGVVVPPKEDPAPSDAGGITPQTTTSQAVIPGTSVVRPTGSQVTTPTPATTSMQLPIPIFQAPTTSEKTSTSTIAEENITPLLWIALAALALLPFGYLVAQSLKKKVQDNEEGKNKCFDIKRLLDKKLEELTDLRGQVEGKIKEKAKETIREGLKDTTAGDILALAEKAEKEYGRLKKIYEECIISIENKKRVVIVHGWEGHPNEGWFPWLKKELEKLGFEVLAPQLPESANPRIEKWVPALTEAVGTANEKTYFVGHSMGCQAIARYLETLPEDKKIGGAVFVAGFFKRLTGLENDLSTHETEQHWLKTSLDFQKVKSHIINSVAIFSDDDPWVPLDNQNEFKEELGSEVIIEHTKGHFSGNRDKTFELPVVLEKIIELSKSK